MVSKVALTLSRLMKPITTPELSHQEVGTGRERPRSSQSFQRGAKDQSENHHTKEKDDSEQEQSESLLNHEELSSQKVDTKKTIHIPDSNRPNKAPVISLKKKPKRGTSFLEVEEQDLEPYLDLQSQLIEDRLRPEAKRALSSYNDSARLAVSGQIRKGLIVNSD